jgi:hypothetical protein
MSATAAVSDGGSPAVGERIRWSSALWTVTERDGRFARIERVGTPPAFGAGALWADTSLLELVSENGGS